MDIKLKDDIKEYQWYDEHGGSFMKTLCKLISLADMENLGKLYKSYPNLVDGYIGSIHGKSWQDYN